MPTQCLPLGLVSSVFPVAHSPWRSLSATCYSTLHRIQHTKDGDSISTHPKLGSAHSRRYLQSATVFTSPYHSLYVGTMPKSTHCFAEELHPGMWPDLPGFLDSTGSRQMFGVLLQSFRFYSCPAEERSRTFLNHVRAAKLSLRYVRVIGGQQTWKMPTPMLMLTVLKDRTDTTSATTFIVAFLAWLSFHSSTSVPSSPKDAYMGTLFQLLSSTQHPPARNIIRVFPNMYLHVTEGTERCSMDGLTGNTDKFQTVCPSLLAVRLTPKTATMIETLELDLTIFALKAPCGEAFRCQQPEKRYLPLVQDHYPQELFTASIRTTSIHSCRSFMLYETTT